MTNSNLELIVFASYMFGKAKIIHACLLFLGQKYFFITQKTTTIQTN